VIIIKSKAQSWSIDISIGVVVFIAAFVVVYVLLGANQNPEIDNLRDEATIIIKEVVSDESKLRIVDNNEINITRLNDLKSIDYEELKRKFRIEGDFCIYIEDEQGNIVLIDDTYKGIGSPNIDIGGTPCSLP